MPNVFVAGATGQLGRAVVARLAAQGASVRVLTRDAARAKGLAATSVHPGDALRPATLTGAFDGIDTVFSSVGASVSLRLGAGWRGYRAVDVPAHRNLLAAAEEAGVTRFVYVSAHVIPETVGCAYFAAHETVAARVLASSALEGRVLRPTAFFSALAMFVGYARRGKVPVLGAGTARTNPISDEDLADACVASIAGEGPRERSLGGPDVMTRDELARLACAAVGVPPRLRHVPAWFARVGSIVMTPLSPRLSQLVRFATEASIRDLVAPVTGTRHLADYFRDVAGALR